MKKYQIFINIYRVKQCVCKKKSNIYYYVKKRLVGVFYNRGERDKDNVTGLKYGGGIEMLTIVLQTRCLLSSLYLHGSSVDAHCGLLIVPNIITG